MEITFVFGAVSCHAVYHLLFVNSIIFNFDGETSMYPANLIIPLKAAPERGESCKMRMF